jgi:thioredoxin-like negative regulator of GroEL
MPGGHSFAGHPGWHGGPGGPGPYHHPGWYHGDWHDHWHGPWGFGPVGWFSVGFVSGAVLWDAPWRWGYYSYYNPYYTEVIVVDGTPIDYSQPIVVAAPPATAVTTAQPSLGDDPSATLLEGARAAFARGDYTAAMTQINQAIAKKPNNAILHEFRSLVLFATAQYKPAAAAAYAVLSVGPGWDWATLSGFYPDVNVYTAQLRALEQYRNGNPNLPEIRFLLAYHYMSCGYSDPAVIELKELVKLNPKDQLAAQLLAGLSGDKTAAPAPAAAGPEIVASPSPVNAANLVGQWNAARSDGSTFQFALTSGSTYSWKFTKSGKVQEYTGDFTVADGLLILKRNGKPVMIGQVTLLDANRFNFKLVSENPSDPGLTFTKKP